MAVELSRDAQRWLARLPEIANLVLVVLIALSAARLFWLVWPVSDTELVPATTGASSDTADQSINVDTIASAHLFGEQTVTDADAQQREIINAPETRLNLTLTGIVSESNGRRSRALIETGRKKQDSFSVDDDVTNGVKLHAIYANRVILDRSGRFETLTLESVKQAKALSGVKRTQAVSSEIAEDLGDVRQKILANPATASRYIRLQPERQNGNLVGYRIYPGADRGLFEKAGLKPGELVTAVNGQPLNNPAASLKLLGNLAQASSASVTLERDGQQRTVTVNF
ncbi:type II secretion system protein GspC [Salinisphaera aquimarina]|uniref:Type II secretion system protein GspC n=1 Tax=Salinisphaera aquimarina TaxID=2094031 RepID=A0ABV7EP93_9GAMM